MAALLAKVVSAIDEEDESAAATVVVGVLSDLVELLSDPLEDAEPEQPCNSPATITGSIKSIVFFMIVCFF
jgi:hypothetical protein